MSPLLVEILTVLILLLPLLTIQELIHWLILLGIRVRIYKSDVDDDVSLDLPYALDDDIIPCLHPPPLLTSPLL